MTRRKPIEITKSEKIVMDIIIKYPEGLFFREIVEILHNYEEGWHPSTIATFLSRLQKKGYLFRTKKLKEKYRYVARLSQDEYQITNDLKEDRQRLARNIKKFANAFDNQEFTSSEMDEILECVKKLQEYVNKKKSD